MRWPNNRFSVSLISNQCLKHFRISLWWNLALFCIVVAQWVPPISGCSLSGSDRPYGLWTMAECTWPHAKRKVNCLSLAAESGNEALLSTQYRSLSKSSLNILTPTLLEISSIFSFWFSKSVNFSSKNLIIFCPLSSRIIIYQTSCK